MYNTDNNNQKRILNRYEYWPPLCQWCFFLFWEENIVCMWQQQKNKRIERMRVRIISCGAQPPLPPSSQANINFEFKRLPRTCDACILFD